MGGGDQHQPRKGALGGGRIQAGRHRVHEPQLFGLVQVDPRLNGVVGGIGALVAAAGPLGPQVAGVAVDVGGFELALGGEGPGLGVFLDKARAAAVGDHVPGLQLSHGRSFGAGRRVSP